MYGLEWTNTVTKKSLKNDAAKMQIVSKERLEKHPKRSLEAVRKRKRSKFCAGQKYESYKTSERFEDRAMPETVLPLVVRRMFSKIGRITNGTELIQKSMEILLKPIPKWIQATLTKL